LDFIEEATSRPDAATVKQVLEVAAIQPKEATDLQGRGAAVSAASGNAGWIRICVTHPAVIRHAADSMRHGFPGAQDAADEFMDARPQRRRKP
jgi:hypothetical protein